MDVFLYALAPVFVILFYIYFRDKYEKEPIGLLIKAVIVGALIVIPVLVAENFISMVTPAFGDTWKAFYTSFFQAGLVEELFKFLGLYFLIWRNPNFNEKFDGIVYAVFVSLGFAAVENIIYVNDGGIKIALIRAITAVPAHALFGIRMGYYFGIAHMYRELRRSYLIKALLFPIILHGMYDFMLLSKNYLFLLAFIPYLVWLYIVGFREMKVISDSSEFRPLEDEVQSEL